MKLCAGVGIGLGLGLELGSGDGADGIRVNQDDSLPAGVVLPAPARSGRL